MFIMINLILSTFIIFLKHPISLGLLILTQTISTCSLMGFLSLNFWFSYILILIMIGGLLILFIYMTSIASNEKFNFNLIILSFMTFSVFLLYYFFKFLNLEHFNMNIMNLNFNEKKNLYFSMSKFYNFPFMNMLIITIIYLLISMIAVIKISSNKNNSLRQM
uniref:NADH-ubiquinone oxidoreductase chain 6 n=1 Tax=Cucujoidea sp. 7 KM-2017 TaxID=2219388 RepID=A0A346RH10_9CUCU|nr:NADH dehydrogenase subunit 6 [Cucujoidea sp. 7 KM-2017]